MTKQTVLRLACIGLDQERCQSDKNFNFFVPLKKVEKGGTWTCSRSLICAKDMNTLLIKNSPGQGYKWKCNFFLFTRNEDLSHWFLHQARAYLFFQQVWHHMHATSEHNKHLLYKALLYAATLNLLQQTIVSNATQNIKK